MNTVELFVGAGGLGMGVSRAGFKPIAVIECDKYSCDTIRDNRERGVDLVADWPLTEGDVREFDYSPLAGKIEMVTGGPPCQPFSIGGRHKAEADARDMFPEAVRAVRELQPKAFLFENVKGLTRSTFTSYFEYIRLQMMYPEITPQPDEEWSDHLTRLERYHTHGRPNELHYRVVTRVLNAANYGVPQRRERVFFVGFRADLDVEWAFPESTHSYNALLWDQVKEGNYWEHHEVPKRERWISERAKRRAEKLDEVPAHKPWRTVRDALVGLPDAETDPEAAEAFHNHKFQPGARTYVGHTGSPYDLPAKTLKAGVHGVPGGENMLLRHDGSVRYFTVRESARLQTFPDDFRFHGSWSETMRQLGNAVPVTLAEFLGRDIGDHIASCAANNDH
ncbi:DNA cytosine methyltransferase [Fodinicurvata fenggangensis]|uniref:DNA cytosine methyltransferase n=1 Tax=Fodinicurvata fenggangensis TaxID=1121830 RepID=UPI00054F90F4|nr:DNA cytosine methyltransferase [Fodinicurvata fenggangensis]